MLCKAITITTSIFIIVDCVSSPSAKLIRPGNRVLVLSVLLLSILISPSRTCPSSCECINKSTVEVSCKDGQLLDIFTQLDFQTYKLTLNNVRDLRTVQKARISDLKTTSFVKLKISTSHVKEIENNAFDRLTALEDLDLSMNELMTISEESFTGLSQLKYLNLSCNRLSTLGQALSPLPKLITLDISANFLKEIPKGAFKSQSILTSLKLDGNPLKNLYSQSFGSLRKVQEFRARDCSLTQVESTVFTEMPSLALIDLGQNRLAHVPSAAALATLILLRTVYLDNNEIQSLESHAFANLHLQAMDLSYNRISKMDPLAFKNASFRELNLSHNLIITLNQELLQPLSNHVAVLNVAGNPLRLLDPHSFSDLHLLETLNLSLCSLETLDPELFKGLPVLRQLDISHNHLHSVSQSALDLFDKLDILAFHENTWQCDCQIKPLRDWLQLASSASKIHCPLFYEEASTRKSKGCGTLRCAKPSDLQNHQISYLQDTELAHCEKSSALPSGTQGAIVASCLGLAIVLLTLSLFLWQRGKTRHGLKRICVPSQAESSHIVDENSKVPPLVDCDRRSLTNSDHNYVIRHYFDHLVTDPKLMDNVDDEEDGDAAAAAEGGPCKSKEKDSLYSSQPSLYSNHSVAVYGVESTV